MRKIKRWKYEGGGTIPYAQAGVIAGDLYDSVTPTNVYGAKTDFNAGIGSALKGAGSGAAIGTTILPGIGTGVGAAIGGIAGYISGKKKNDIVQGVQASAQDANSLRLQQEQRARLMGADLLGSNTNDVYAKYGGSLKQLSSDTVEVNGPSHEQGGVNIGRNVEVEGNETINNDFVFSDELGFSERHKPIAKAIGKMEAKVPNNITTATIKILKDKEEALKVEQEDLKARLGLTPISQSKAFGGYLDPEPKRNPRYYIDQELQKNYPGISLSILDRTNKPVVPGIPDTPAMSAARKGYSSTITNPISNPIIRPRIGIGADSVRIANNRIGLRTR